MINYTPVEKKKDIFKLSIPQLAVLAKTGNTEARKLLNRLCQLKN